MKSHIVIIECVGYVFWQLFFAAIIDILPSVPKAVGAKIKLFESAILCFYERYNFMILAWPMSLLLLIIFI